MEIEVDNNFDEKFYEIVCPEVKNYHKDSELSERERYYHHYLKYGQHLYKNREDAETKLFGDVKEDFNEDLHEKRHPEVKEYMIYMGNWVSDLSKKKRYYHHYSNYCIPGCDTSSLTEVKEYSQNIRKILIESQDKYEYHKESIVLVNHVSNPYGATHYLLTLFKLLKSKGIKVCLLDEIINEKLYSKYQIDTKDVISYEQDLLLLCYIYEKLKPKIFYLNSIRGIFIDFIKLKNPNVITHSHEIADVYRRYDLLPTYVVSERIQKEFEDKYKHKPKIQPPIFLDETLKLIDEEFGKELPKVSNHKGDMDLSKITIGMCGQTETRKNPKLFEEVSKLYQQYNLLWIGGEEGYFPPIDNLYHIPLVQLPFIYYKLIDYFVLFSQEDPCPYVVLENLYVNNKVIAFKDNIYTDHKCEQTKDIYFEFDGGVSIENLCKVIDQQVVEKTNRKGNGKRYIVDNFTTINMDCLISEKSEDVRDIDYFIVCHDQNIIIDCLKTDKFATLPNYRFIFVGNKPTNLIENIENVSICNKLEFNIENCPRLCSFTAWYAIVKNRLYTSNHLCLLEYDIEYSKELHNKNRFAISNAMHPSIYGYSKAPVNHRVFYRSTPILELALNQTYNIDLLSFINDYRQQGKYWLTTTNMMMHKNVLCSFVDWYFPMIEKFKHEPMSAYVHERAIHVFSLLNNIQLNYIQNSIKHHQKCSHNIEDVYGYFLKKKQEKCLIPSDIAEYDLLYKKMLFELDKKYNSGMIDHVNSKEIGSK